MAVPVHGPDEVRAAVATSRAAQAGWARRPVRERLRIMARLAAVLADRKHEIADRVRAETGKPRIEALAEVAVSADLIRFYVRAAPGVLRRRRVGSGWLLHRSARVEQEPYGVIGAITPWNYPFILVMDCVTPALVAGNGVVVKPSEFTPSTALLVPELGRAAGLPDGLIQVVTGFGETGAALIGAGVDKVSFTGSTATGRKVMEAAAKGPTPVTMELGGKDPAIVLADADLARAARGVAYGSFFNAGQTCISVERVFVERSVHDAFVERLAEEAGRLRAGSGPDADVGPLVNERQMAVVERQVADAVARGAVARSGGTHGDGTRVFLPTVLTGVTDAMAVQTEETFGPVVTVTPVADEAEAVRLANGTGYGLFASVWTGDRARGLRVARQLRAGGVSLNDVLSHYAVPGLPMGGRGESGFGSRRGVEGLREMVRPRTLLVDRFGFGREVWWFPYAPAGERLVEAVTEWRARRGFAGLWRAARVLLGRGGKA